MTTAPLPARETQAPVAIPFSHAGGTDADVLARVCKLPYDTVVDRVDYLNPTGLAEAVANFAAFVLQRPLVIDDLTLDTGNADLTGETVKFKDASGVALRHGIETGDGPIRFTTTGALPTGLAAATDYWAIRVDDFKIALSTTLNNAIGGTKINLTGQGSGVNVLIDQSGTKRRLAWKSTNSAQVLADDSIAANTWYTLTLNRNDARVVPAGAEIEFLADEEGTTNPPAGQGMIWGRFIK